MFFQWVFGISIGIYSLIVAQVRGNPTFYPITMLGGALFITGKSICKTYKDHIEKSIITSIALATYYNLSYFYQHNAIFLI